MKSAWRIPAVVLLLAASSLEQRRGGTSRSFQREYRIWDASYGNLTCFSCSLDFRFNKFNGKDPCLGVYEPVNKTNLVRCGVNEIYCKEDFLTGNGILWTVHRQCTAICYSGCRPRGFGITHTACTRCCTKHGCNSSPPSGLSGLGVTSDNKRN